MLPLGYLGPAPWWGKARQTRLSHDETASIPDFVVNVSLALMRAEIYLKRCLDHLTANELRG